MDILNTKIKNILTEKTLKVRPENIKDGVTIFGVEGTLETGTGDITETEDYIACDELADDIIGEEEYVELDYIQSTGTQYINTNYYPNQDTKIVLKMKTEGLLQGTDAFNAFGTAGVNSRFGWWTYYYGSSYFRYGIEGGGRDSKISVATTFENADFTVTLDSSTAIIETPSQTYSYSVIPTNNFTVELPLILGGHIWNNGASIGQCGCKYKLYSCQIYENNVLIKNYIPVKRKSDNKVGLYETISDLFFFSAGVDDYVEEV